MIIHFWKQPVSQCRARAWVAKDLEFDSARRINLFETTIRIVGGLLSAFQLSEDPVFLVRAEELVQKMLPAFEQPDTCERCSGSCCCM